MKTLWFYIENLIVSISFLLAWFCIAASSLVIITFIFILIKIEMLEIDDDVDDQEELKSFFKLPYYFLLLAFNLNDANASEPQHDAKDEDDGFAY